MRVSRYGRDYRHRGEGGRGMRLPHVAAGARFRYRNAPFVQGGSVEPDATVAALFGRPVFPVPTVANEVRAGCGPRAGKRRCTEDWGRRARRYQGAAEV